MESQKNGGMGKENRATFEKSVFRRRSLGNPEPERDGGKAVTQRAPTGNTKLFSVSA